MKIAICDDSKESIAILEDVVEQMKIRGAETDCFYSGDSLLEFVGKQEEYYYQIYLLDIEMPGTNGMETARQIRAKDNRAVIIFITSYDDYVFESFEVLPFRFIRKPVRKEQIREILHAAVDYLYSAKRYLFISVDKEKFQVCCDKIRYFEGEKRKIHIHTTEEELTFYARMAEVEEMVDSSNFVRIHVSFIINLDYVKAFYPDEVLLTDGTRLPISKKYRKSVKDHHLQYTKWRMGL